MKENSLKKGIIVIFIANIINLLLSIIRNFIMPKYLSIDAYATIKTYQLFITYIGILALGYIDGMYLKYGGKDLQTIDKNIFFENLSTFRIFQFAISIVVITISLILKDFLILAVGFTIISLNVTDYLKSYYQAVGEFSKYSKIMNFSSIIMFLGNIILLVVIKSKNPLHYIYCNVFVYYLVWILLELTIKENKSLKKMYLSFSRLELKYSIKNGYILMIGLLLSNFMTGIDRWFIKFTMDNLAFALYSFSASMEGFLSFAISPISITLYNHFCKEENEENLNKMKQYILVFLALIIAIAYPIKFIVNIFLPQYNSAIIILFILFSAQLIYALIRCFYLNIYKAQQKQKIYFKRIILVVLIGFILNLILFYIMKKMEAYAIGTFASAVVWLKLCERDHYKYKCNIQEKLYIVFSIIIFFIAGLFFTPVIGMVVYVIFWSILSFIIFKQRVRELWQMIKGIIRR